MTPPRRAAAAGVVPLSPKRKWQTITVATLLLVPAYWSILAGFVDGADHFTIFWRLVVPLSVPALAAFAIFQFLWVWNDLLVAYVFLGGGRDNRVLTEALRGLSGSRGQDWHLLTAAAFITMSLPIVVFFSLQRYFVRGLTAGSVKG